jgi:hypothetical protein
VPFIALALGGATLALYHFNQRRARVEALQEKNDDRK